METINKTYSEVLKLKTFEERFNYLKLDSIVCEETFGSSRYINQKFYNSYEWKKIRDRVIIRDNGCDLGIDGFTIYKKILIHHINPITVEDLVNLSEKVFDMENLICVSHKTHNAIHYGTDEYIFQNEPTERKQGDTKLW